MPLTPARGFMTGQVTATGTPTSLYALLVALDPTTNWPRSARNVFAVASASTVILTDGSHTGIPLIAATWLAFGQDGYQNVYLDQMFISGTGTLSVAIFS